MKKQFAVFGNPIKQSLSPQIHHQFASQHQLDISYQKILSDDNLFDSSVLEFFDNGGDGCNVTAPFKELAFKLCDELSESAQRAQAVNTIYKSDSGKLTGHNTDGTGLLCDLTENLQLNLEGTNIFVLGAGGATRGILQPLILQKPSSITIVNRTLSKAQTLANEFSDLFSIDTIASDNITTPETPVDLIINATSASLSAELPIADNSLISQITTCYDLSYAQEPTRFLQWTKDNGCRHNHDGRGMLVEQAAHAFTTWTKLEVSTDYLIKNFAKLGD